VSVVHVMELLSIDGLSQLGAPTRDRSGGCLVAARPPEPPYGAYLSHRFFELVGRPVAVALPDRSMQASLVMFTVCSDCSADTPSALG
jgi:hypothetical protein